MVEETRAPVDAVLSGIVRGVYAKRGPTARTIVGLGTHCYTATLLKSAGIKDASYPFDWLFSAPQMVAHCLDDDFATFLDRRYYEPVPPERRRDGPTVNLCDHRFYRDEHGVPFVFNHRDPLDDADYAYLRRCVERFRDVARAGTATFLLTTFPSEYWQRGFERVSRALRAYAPAARLVYVVVSPPGESGLPQPRIEEERDGHTCVELIPGSEWHPLWFDNVLDDIALLTLALERT